MPIVSGDKFNYFRPEAGVSNIKAPSFAPTAPVSSDDVSKLAGAYQLRVGDELEQMGKVIRQAQVRDDVQRFTFKALEDVASAEAEEMQTGGHRDLPARFGERLKGIHQKYRDEIGGDQEVYTAFQEKFALLASNHQQKIRLTSWKRELDQQQATTIEGGATALNLIGQASSMGEIDTIRNDYLAAGDKKAENGLIDASWWQGHKILFNQKAGASLVEQDMLVEQAGAVPAGVTVTKLTSEQWKSHYPGLSEDGRNQYLNAAMKQTVAIKNQIRIQEEREERAAENKVKQDQSNTYGDALVLYSQGKLTLPMIANLIATRSIDPESHGKGLIESLKTEGRRDDKIENNPVVLGDLVTRLELGDNIGPDLDRAQAMGEVKTETYLGLKKQLANDMFNRGLSYINNSLKPGENERDLQRNIRHATAVENYIKRTANKEDPMTVADDVVLTALGQKRNAFMALPTPMFLEGSRSDLGNLNKARIKTVEQFHAGSITPEVYAREIRILDDLRYRKREQDIAEQQRLSIGGKNVETRAKNAAKRLN